jgi:superfamily II DNA or RNA helicase
VNAYAEIYNSVNESTEVIRGTNGRLLNAILPAFLPLASRYQRAVGYFSSSVFEAASPAFEKFFSLGGQMELVCSPSLTEKDVRALHDALYSDRKYTYMRWNQHLIGQDVLLSAVRNNQLTIQIAMFDDQRRHGIYHEKIGLLDLRDGRTIAIEGSANETSSAYTSNFERIAIHARQSGGSHRWVEAIRQDFERLWRNLTPGIRTISLHQAFVESRLELRSFDGRAFGAFPAEKELQFMKALPEILRLPPRLELRNYQKLAIDSWFRAGGVGVFSMATGSGKTITALAALEALFRRVGPPLIIIIVAPYLNLVDQWIAEASKFGLTPINCSGSSSSWVPLVEAALFLNHTGKRPILSLVTTNKTFAQEHFQHILERLRVRTVLVGDEVHNLGARHLTLKLPHKVSLRLGLSATPQRWMDEEGTKAIRDYFGESVIDFGLEDALCGPDKSLCSYVYNPTLVYLDDDEVAEYLRITKQLARCFVDPRVENLSDLALTLLLKRSRLIASAKGKLPAFARVISGYRKTRYNLVYCGDGRVEMEAAGLDFGQGVSEKEILHQVDAVTRLLGHGLEMDVTKYTAEMDREQRRSALSEFEKGNKQALVAIRCLDEGVDIPEVRRAFFLASSSNPRQFVQRRGRILRRAEGKDQAEIFDFIVVPPLEHITPEVAEFSTMRNLVEREMSRVVEFAKLAINGPQALGKLRPVLERLRLLHLL